MKTMVEVQCQLIDY